MADSKLTELTEITAPISTDITYLVSDPGGSPAEKKLALSHVIGYAVCNGRLTLETGVPISTSDQTAKTTVYFTPYKGNLIGLYNGSSAWTMLSFSELSLSLADYTADKNYDIWVYNNSGTAALDSTIWTDDATRATALALQDGIYVKTGATTRRYVGTIRITATTGQCEDSDANRFVWNYYNRVSRRNFKTDATAHDYTTNAWRYWNNTDTHNLKFVVGVAEEVSATHITAYHDGLGIIGLDDDAATGGDLSIGYVFVTAASGSAFSVGGGGSKIFAAGYHYLAIMEYGG